MNSIELDKLNSDLKSLKEAIKRYRKCSDDWERLVNLKQELSEQLHHDLLKERGQHLHLQDHVKTLVEDLRNARNEVERLNDLLPTEDEKFMIRNCAKQAAMQIGGSIVHEAIQIMDWVDRVEGIEYEDEE